MNACAGPPTPAINSFLSLLTSQRLKMDELHNQIRTRILLYLSDNVKSESRQVDNVQYSIHVFDKETMLHSPRLRQFMCFVNSCEYLVDVLIGDRNNLISITCRFHSEKNLPPPVIPILKSTTVLCKKRKHDDLIIENPKINCTIIELKKMKCLTNNNFLVNHMSLEKKLQNFHIQAQFIQKSTFRLSYLLKCLDDFVLQMKNDHIELKAALESN